MADPSLPNPGPGQLERHHGGRNHLCSAMRRRSHFSDEPMRWSEPKQKGGFDQWKA